MRILNLYSGIGGNRRLWSSDHDVTAVESDPEIANVYSDLFPQDTVVVGDAHAHLLEHYGEFDFIWSSPPCQTHSRIRYFRGLPPAYADMRLYEEIVLLRTHSDAQWVVENVVPYYGALLPAQRIDRHLYWSNFLIPPIPERQASEGLKRANVAQLEALHGFDLSKYKLKDKRQVLRNCVSPAVGAHILSSAIAADSFQKISP